MLQVAQHVLSNGLLCMGLHIEQIEIISPLWYLPAPLYCSALTVWGSFELHVHLANVIVHQVYFPVAHHPVHQRT